MLNGLPASALSPYTLSAICFHPPYANVLALSEGDLLEVYKNVGQGNKIDIYICADNAGLGCLDQILSIIDNNIDALMPHLLERIALASEDFTISRIIALICGAQLEHWEKHKQLSLDSRSLQIVMDKAICISDAQLRKICLDWLEPMGKLVQ